MDKRTYIALLDRNLVPRRDRSTFEIPAAIALQMKRMVMETMGPEQLVSMNSDHKQITPPTPFNHKIS